MVVGDVGHVAVVVWRVMDRSTRAEESPTKIVINVTISKRTSTSIAFKIIDI